jgi:hypothetical protein
VRTTTTTNTTTTTRDGGEGKRSSSSSSSSSSSRESASAIHRRRRHPFSSLHALQSCSMREKTLLLRRGSSSGRRRRRRTTTTRRRSGTTTSSSASSELSQHRATNEHNRSSLSLTLESHFFALARLLCEISLSVERDAFRRWKWGRFRTRLGFSAFFFTFVPNSSLFFFCFFSLKKRVASRTISRPLVLKWCSFLPFFNFWALLLILTKKRRRSSLSLFCARLYAHVRNNITDRQTDASSDIANAHSSPANNLFLIPSSRGTRIYLFFIAI